MTHMNDYIGKRFLATVRNGDYAHAGEEESIQLVFQNENKDSGKQILDMGCGRGGTANYVQTHGWGKVTGIDIEPESIEEAKTKYPNIEFHVEDVNQIGAKFPARFDLIYLFNVFYAFPDPELAMNNLRQVAKPGGKLLLFDYLAYRPELYPTEMLAFSPPTSEQFEQLFQKNNWQVENKLNLDEDYIRWYKNFLDRFSSPEVKKAFEPEYIEAARKKYEALYNVHRNRIFGGRLYSCTAI